MHKYLRDIFLRLPALRNYATRVAVSILCLPASLILQAIAADTDSGLAAAREAFQDELYESAARRLEAFIPNAATGSTERAQGALLLADVYEKQCRFEEMSALLSRHEAEIVGTAREPAWLATRAAAEAGTGRVAAGLRLIAELEQRFPKADELKRAERLRGWCLARLGRFEEALAAFQAYDALHGSEPEAAANRLDWARALLGVGRSDEAAALLNDPAAWPETGPFAEDRKLCLAELAVARHEDLKAIEVLEQLIDSRTMRESTRAAALFLMAETMERQTNSAAALAALREGAVCLTEPALQRSAGLREGLLLLRMGRFEEGMARVHAFVSANVTNEAAEGVQLALARTFLDNGLLEQAAVEYQHYLEAFSDPAGIIQALRGRGWALFKLGRFAEALEVFRKTRSMTLAPVDREWFLCRIADSLFANAQYQQARESYQQALKEFPSSPQSDQFHFQSIECSARLGEDAAARAGFMELSETASVPDVRASALMRAADLTLRQGRFLEAHEIYRKLLEQPLSDSIRAAARHSLGLLLYRQGRFKDALENFERVARDLPGNDFAEQAQIMIAWSNYMIGNRETALKILHEFAGRYPTSASMPDVLFWMGEFEYNSGGFAAAELNFKELAQKHPASSQADAAWFWAGRAAFMQKDFKRANEYFVALLKERPQTPRRAEARYYQAEALCELGDFPAAILLYDEIIKQFPESYLWDLSCCRKGDCQYTLSSSDPRRYEEAMASYQVMLDRTEAQKELRLRAEYGIARCLDKLQRAEKAFDRYMNVVYKYFENRERNTPECDVWFTRAAFNAAEIKELEKSWRAAANIYQRIVDAGVTAAADAQLRIQKIKTEQWLFFY